MAAQQEAIFGIRHGLCFTFNRVGKAKSRGLAVVLEAGTPNPMKDAGSRAVVDLVDGLQHLGFNAELAVETDRDRLKLLTEQAPTLAVISRPGTFMRNVHRFDRSLTKVAYFAHDLHSVRMRAGIEFDPMFSERSALAMEIVEKRCLALANISLFPTQAEAALAQKLSPGSTATAVNYYWFDPAARKPRDDRPVQLVFVGSRDHLPNSDGLSWFLREIWPATLEARPDVQLVLVGEWDDIVAEHDSQSTTVQSKLTDEALDDLLSSCDLGIAPLRFGAGMKRKTVHYFARGLPVVTTSYGAQGLEEALQENSAALVADDRDGFLEAIMSIIDQPVLSRRLSQAASALIRKRFSLEAFRHKLTAALSE